MKESGRQDRRRVAFLFGHLHKGGMQKAVSNISCALPDNIDQFIVYFGTEIPGFEYKARMIDLNVPGSLNTGIFFKFLNFISRIKKLQSFIDGNGIETVVSFGETANILNVLTRRKKTVLSVRVSISESLSSLRLYETIYKFLIRFFYKKSDKVIAVSKSIAENLIAEYHVPADKIEVIYNLYDIEKIKKLAAEPLEPPIERIFKNPVVINIGSLNHQKAQEYLIRAFSLAKERNKELELVIVGEGGLKGYLESLAEDMDISGSVHFLGFQTNPYKYLSRANVFVLTSRYEGFPNALVEAMACGLPVIATDCKTGPREILLESEYGVLLQNINSENVLKTVSDIAEWIERLISDDQAYEDYKRKGIKRSQAFSRDKIISNWLSVILTNKI